jgi:hypothetical protein
MQMIFSITRRLQPGHHSTSEINSLLWGLIVIAFFFLLRRSEFAIKSRVSLQHAFQNQDLAVVDADGHPTSEYSRAHRVFLKLRSSKTDQSAKGVTRVLFKSGDPLVCPVRAALLIKSIHARSRSPLTAPAALHQLSGTYISNQLISSAVKQAAIDSGENPRDYASHSLRVGGATYLFRQGVDPLLIKMHGRWLSDVFRQYIHTCEKMAKGLARKMVEDKGPLLLLQRRN